MEMNETTTAERCCELILSSFESASKLLGFRTSKINWNFRSCSARFLVFARGRSKMPAPNSEGIFNLIGGELLWMLLSKEVNYVEYFVCILGFAVDFNDIP